MINKENGVACYQQLSKILIEQIEKGIFKPGSQLATEIELSKRYRLNRHTVRQAIERLEDEGLVYKIKGKGTFVADYKIPYKVSKKTQFTTSILDVGLNPDARLIDYYEISAGRELSKKLNISASDRVIVLEILRFVNKVPFCHTTSFLSSKNFPGLRNFIDGSFSLYGLLKKHYGVDATRASSTFEVSMPESSDMDMLNISPKVPMLAVKSISKDQKGGMVEYCITKFRGDMCSVSVDFNGEGR
ncbi:MAG: phosphonate metabolism transcriptional regulator PhnF [Nitrospirae bacterium]|nr:phosphonate metabolism transcriptional regulator PhnF [Nitrospirota bacterium]MCL5421946.1 phosphonate metabolism transcriptional regulator PhnF [Nitrospirota bacterium]